MHPGVLSFRQQRVGVDELESLGCSRTPDRGRSWPERRFARRECKTGMLVDTTWTCADHPKWLTVGPLGHDRRDREAGRSRKPFVGRDERGTDVFCEDDVEARPQR